MSKYAKLFKKDGDKSFDHLDPVHEGGPQEAYALLFVDDEKDVLKALQRVFFEEDYRILTAESADKALDILAREQVHLVISDHRMPGMTGAEFLRKVKKTWPDTIRIMLTGFADIQSIMGAVNEGAVYKFITKPWSDEDLRLSVSLALQQYDLKKENIKLKEINREQKAKIEKYYSVIDEDKGIVGSYLVRAGEITKDQLEQAKKKKREEELLGDTLVRLGFTNDAMIVKVFQKYLKIDHIDLKEMRLNPNVVSFLPRDLCERNRLIPVKLEGKKITIAMADPSDVYKCDNIAMMTGLQVVPLVTKSSDILYQLEKIYGDGSDDSYDDISLLMDIDPQDEIDIIIEEDEEQVNVAELIGSSKVPPVIRIVNAIIAEAIRYKASDLHIESKTKHTIVRFRIDGMLYHKINIPSDIHPAVVSRIKILAKMDIAERRNPQDGRITVRSGTRMVDIRVSIIPTINGEKVVMRILDKNAAIKKLSELGMQPADLDRIEHLTKKPQGIIIATGPTGSGKTTMLYSILSSMMDSTRNFQTIEDPVEYYLEEANQIFVKEKIGMSFSSILRSTLRQDPDVILVGEIRDLETADVAFKAALTGHVVLSTLHTNNSVASITRLIDLGVRPYLIASAIEGILAQRLIRKICLHCRKEVKPDDAIVQLLNIQMGRLGEKVSAGTGCNHCNNTGYAGRMGIFELFVMGDEFRQFVCSSEYREGELVKMARLAGMTTLLEDGLTRVEQGVTTLEELLRVVGSQSHYKYKCQNCLQSIDLDHLFCPYCGQSNMYKCPHCRMQLEKEWSHCPSCGKVMER